MSWDSPLDPPLEPVTSWPQPSQLQLIETVDDVPQLYKPQEAPKYPRDIIAFTDQLHDQGHVELGLLVLHEYTRLERLIAFGRLMLQDGK